MDLKIIILWMAVTLPACAQTWFKVAVENPATTVTLPSGAAYRFGATASTSGACGALGWLSGFSTGVPLPAYYTSFACDPAPNVVKELDVLQTASPQTVKLTTNGQTSTVTVPALAVTQGATKATVVATFTCTVNLYSDGSYASTSCTKAGK
jgi:hypothetical protein